MQIMIGDLLTIEENKYITLEKLTYNNDNYIFVNKVIDDDNVSDEFYIFKIINDSVIMIEEDNLKNILIPKFEKLLKNDIIELMQEQ